MVVRVLCAGAVKGLVQALQPEFSSTTGSELEGTFGAVGTIKAQLLAGAPCDVIVLTAALIDELAQQKHLIAGSTVPLGRIATGVAVRCGEALPDVADAASFAASLQAARGIYFPDPERATAGIHFVNVLKQLGIYAAVENQLRPFPSGAVAMLELSKSSGAQLIGCTQISEIHYTDGVTLAGPFPKAFELATLYSAGICSQAANPALARQLLDLLAGSGSRQLRLAGGFEL